MIEEVRAKLVEPVLRRHQQGCPTIAARLVDISTLGEQRLDGFERVGSGGINQRCEAAAAPVVVLAKKTAAALLCSPVLTLLIRPWLRAACGLPARGRRLALSRGLPLRRWGRELTVVLRRERRHFLRRRPCRSRGEGPVRFSGIVGLSEIGRPATRGRARSCGEVRSVIEQKLHGVRVSLVRRPHQRGRPAQAFLSVHLRAVVEQRLDGRQVARPRCHHQRRLPSRHLLVGIRARLQQALDDGRVAVERGERQRRGAFAVGGLHVGSGLNQQVGRDRIVAVHRPVQRRRPIGLGRVHVGLLRQERAHGGAVAAHDGVGDVAAGRAHRDH